MLARALMTIGVGTLTLIPVRLVAQEEVKLSAVLTAFLADSGVRTRGLPWTTGTGLPVKWATPRPIAADDWERQQGFALSRSGSILVKVGNHPPTEMTLQLSGNGAGLQRVTVGVVLTETDQLKKEEFRAALAAEGIGLTPLKCDATKEGYTYGNLVFVAKAPGKTASGLHENWNCAQGECGWMISILYRRSDVTPIECAS